MKSEFQIKFKQWKDKSKKAKKTTKEQKTKWGRFCCLRRKK